MRPTERKMMFWRKPKVNPKLDPVIDDILDELNAITPGDEKYPELLKLLERTMALKEAAKPTRSIDPNTVVLVGGTLLQILAIVAYEQKHVFVSKGLGIITKPPK